MATTYDKASLVMIPSGVKEDKLYSIKPTDGSGDFTFSRNSDIQATRVNSSGLIEKAKVNLLLQSNTFDTTWTNVNTSETGGQAGYDGSSDAWLLTRSGGLARIVQSISINSVSTFSVYAKAGTQSWIWLRDAGGVGSYFDLGSGALGTGSAIIDANIESVGSGWYRCSITAAFNTAEFRIYVADADNDASGTSGNIYIQDAQLNYGLVAQDYVETTTTSVVEGLTADLPRLDYSGGASCPSLLLEPQRVNLLLHSEYFGYWSVSNLTATANSANSPEGNQNAYLISSTGSGNHPIYRGTSCANGTYTMSVFLKKGAVTAFSSWEDGYSTTGIQVNLDDVSVTPKNANTLNPFIEPYDNGWYRVGYSFSNTSGIVQPALYLQDASGNTNHTANGETIYMFGAQLEAGSYPTSYIPTYGASASRGYEILSTPDLDAAGIATNPTAWTLIIKADYIANGAILGNNHTISRNEGGGMYRYSSSLGFTSASKGYWAEYNPSTPTAYIWDGTQLRVRRGGSDIRTISATDIGWNSGGINNWTLNSVDIRRISMDVEQILIFNSVLTNSEIDSLTA